MRATHPVSTNRSRPTMGESSLALLSRFFTWKNLLLNCVLALGYMLTGELGVLLSQPQDAATPVWLPAGISLAAVLLQGSLVWPGIFLGSLLINLHAHAMFLPSAGFAAASTLEALLAAYLVNRFAGGTRAFFGGTYALRFVIIAGLAVTALCATLGSLVACGAGLTAWAGFGQLWWLWWTADVLGTLLICPFLVILLGHSHPALGAAELIELSVLLGILSLICVLNFGPSVAPWIPKSGLFYLCAPCLAWVAIRFCPLEASGTTLLMGGFVMWGSLHGYGLFASATYPPYLGAGYVAMSCATTLVGAAAFAEQGQNLENALGSYYRLKQKYDERISAETEQNLHGDSEPMDVRIHVDEE